jgi:two-component system, OmpR family, sensor histidine kinase KdpD
MKELDDPEAQHPLCVKPDKRQSGSGSSKNGQRVLVLVGTSPYGEELVRIAHRMASQQQVSWHATYVEASASGSSGSRAQTRVWSVLRLAESLGGTTSILTGPSSADAVLAHAREMGITQIVVGNPDLPAWRRILGLGLIDRLLRASHDVDLYVVNHQERSEPADSPRPHRDPGPSWQYPAALGLVALATVGGLPARGLVTSSTFITPYLLALVIAAVYLDFGATMLVALCSVLAFDLVFLPPYYRLVPSDWSNLLPLIGFLPIGGVISSLVSRSRHQTEAARQREAHTHALYSLSRALAASTDITAILSVVIEHWCRLFGTEAAVMIADGEGLIVGGKSAGFELTPAAVEAAGRTYNAVSSAKGAPPNSRDPGLPQTVLSTANGVVGILIEQWNTPHRQPTPELDRMMEAFANQAALAIERVQFAQQAQKAEVLKVTETLQTALLNSVSHDLRTPLSSITGVLSSIYEEAYLLDGQTQHELVGTALSEAKRLNHLVGKLLDMSRIEAGALQLTQELNEVEDVVGTTLVNLERQMETRPIEVRMPEALPLVPMDFVLISRVIHNLVENADKYAPEGTPIEIEARLNGAWLEISVTDSGPGVPDKDLVRIFDKFYRSSRTGTTVGTGLGLAISKGILEAHGGRIWAENREGGGLRVTAALPQPERTTPRYSEEDAGND